MELLAEVEPGSYHEHREPKIAALRKHGPVLRTAGPDGTPTAEYVAEAVAAKAAALYMWSEVDVVSTADLLPLAPHLRALEVGRQLLDPGALASFPRLVAALGAISSLRWLLLSDAQKVSDLSGLPLDLHLAPKG